MKRQSKRRHGHSFVVRSYGSLPAACLPVGRAGTASARNRLRIETRSAKGAPQDDNMKANGNRMRTVAGGPKTKKPPNFRRLVTPLFRL